MSKISQGNKFRKVVQIEFKTEKEYAVLHQRAVKLFGDNHRADSSYIRECCRKQRTEKKQTLREKARSLVESTQRLNELAQKTKNTCIEDNVNEVLKEQVAQWQY